MFCFLTEALLIYQFEVLAEDLGEPLVVLQSCDDGHQVSRRQQQKRSEEQRSGSCCPHTGSPVLQVSEVLQVQLSGVLAQVDGVNVLSQGSEKADNSKSYRCTQRWSRTGVAQLQVLTHWTSSL